MNTLRRISADELATLPPEIATAKRRAAKVVRPKDIHIDPAIDDAINASKGLPPAPAAPPSLPPMPEWGLGTLATKNIDLVSFGLARPLANAIASLFGDGGCRCAARALCMNLVVPDVRSLGAIDWVKKFPAILKCLGAKNPDDSAASASNAQ